MKKAIAKLFFLAMFFFAGCAGRTSSKIDSGGAAAHTPEPFAPSYSIIYVPVEIKTPYLENAVNSQLSGTLYKDTASIGGITKVAMAARRNGQIKITARGNELVYSVPLKVSINVTTTITALGLSHTERQSAEAGITLSLRSRFKLRNDWRLVTTTRADGYRWTNDPVVKIRGATIPVKPIADAFVSANLNTLGGIVDKAIAESADIKGLIGVQAWRTLRAPQKIVIKNSPIKQDIWLRLAPSDIYMSQLRGEGGAIKGTVGIRAITETFIGTKPDTLPPSPIPDFKDPPEEDRSFTINLYSEIPYADATDVCREMFVGQTFKTKKGNQKVTVHDIEITRTKNGKAAVTMDVSGSIKGRVCVTGTPTYNEKNRALSFENLEFDAVTNNKFQKAKNWLLRGIIIARMKPMMVFPLGETLDDAKALAGAMLSGHELTAGITLSGRVEEITVGGIETTGTGIRVMVFARGEVGVGVK